MSRNVIRRTNSLQAGRLTAWIAGLLFLTILSFVFLLFHIRGIQLADEVKKLEVNLAELQKRNSYLQLEIERRTKPKALAEKVAAFQLNLVGVSELQTVEAQVPMANGAYHAYAQKEDAR